MANHGGSQIEARDRPWRWIEFHDAAEIESELRLVFNWRNEHPRAGLTNAADAFVEEPREAWSYFPEYAEPIPAHADLRAKESLDAPALIAQRVFGKDWC